MTRRKPPKKIEHADRLLCAELRRLLIDICAQSRKDICYYDQTPSWRHYACVSGLLPGWREPEPPTKIQRWDFADRECLNLWLEWARAGEVKPVDPIPPLEMLAREAE